MNTYPVGRAIYDYQALNYDEVSIGANYEFYILATDDGSGWIQVNFNGVQGKFPASYVEVIPDFSFSNDHQQEQQTNNVPMNNAPSNNTKDNNSNNNNKDTKDNRPPHKEKHLPSINFPSLRKGTKNTKQQEKIIESIMADNSKVDKINNMTTEIESLVKKDLVEISKMVKKYQESVNVLAEVGIKLAVSIKGYGEKYSSTYSEEIKALSKSMTDIENERKNWTGALESIPDFLKDMENELKKNNLIVFNKMKTKNKNMDEHLKKQGKSFVLLEDSLQKDGAEKMTAITIEMDKIRDDMIANLYEIKNMISSKFLNRTAFFSIFSTEIQFYRKRFSRIKSIQMERRNSSWN